MLSSKKKAALKCYTSTEVCKMCFEARQNSMAKNLEEALDKGCHLLICKYI